MRCNIEILTVKDAFRFFSVLVLYLLVGIVIQVGVRKKRGIESIPNSTFWTGLPGTIKVRIFHHFIYRNLTNQICASKHTFCDRQPRLFYVHSGSSGIVQTRRFPHEIEHMSLVMRKPAFSICENKDAD